MVYMNYKSEIKSKNLALGKMIYEVKLFIQYNFSVLQLWITISTETIINKLKN